MYAKGSIFLSVWPKLVKKNTLVLTFIDSTIPFKSILQLSMDSGDVLHGGSGVDPFQGHLHAVVGYEGTDEHAHHVDVM